MALGRREAEPIGGGPVVTTHAITVLIGDSKSRLRLGVPEPSGLEKQGNGVLIVIAINQRDAALPKAFGVGAICR